MLKALNQIAGVDPEFIAVSPKIEQRSVTAMGILIVLITLLAFVSAGFSMWLIFFPTGFYWQLHAFGLVLGLFVFLTFWSWCVFNFFRFIVSSFSSYGHEFTRKDQPKFFLQIAFGLVLGTAIAIPVSVTLTYKDLKSDLLPDQVRYIVDVKKDTDKKYESALNLLYSKYVDVNREYELVKSNYENISKLSPMGSPEVMDAVNKINGLVEDSKRIDQSIKDLREKIRSETEKVELDIASNHSLIDGIGKALLFNSSLVFLVWLFINIIVAFPVFHVMFHFAGVYETLVACENAIVLAGEGVMSKATQIYLGDEKIDVPYYASAAAILAKKQFELRVKLEENSKRIKVSFNERLESFRSSAGQINHEK